METHFEGSRGAEHASGPHQRQYDEQNPDNINNLESESDPRLDSDINTDFEADPNSNESLTIDEDAGTDPNQVDDKPSFKNDNR